LAWLALTRLVMLSELFKILPAGAFLVATTMWFYPASSYAGGLVEVVLADKLDDSRGFCLDVVGSKQQAKAERGLQAHTCYSSPPHPPPPPPHPTHHTHTPHTHTHPT